MDSEKIDFRKFNQNFKVEILRELNFEKELENLKKTRSNFWFYKDIYIPRPYTFPDFKDYIDLKRFLIMEYTPGLRIN